MAKSSGRPKAPRNTYLLFSQAERKKQPSDHPIKANEISERWHNLSDAEKKVFTF